MPLSLARHAIACFFYCVRSGADAHTVAQIVLSTACKAEGPPPAPPDVLPEDYRWFLPRYLFGSVCALSAVLGFTIGLRAIARNSPIPTAEAGQLSYVHDPACTQRTACILHARMHAVPDPVYMLLAQSNQVTPVCWHGSCLQAIANHICRTSERRRNAAVIKNAKGSFCKYTLRDIFLFTYLAYILIMHALHTYTESFDTLCIACARTSIKH